MSLVDTNLIETRFNQSLALNDNLTDGQKVILYTYLLNIKRVYNICKIDHSFENFFKVLEGIKIVESDSEEIFYDQDNNSLVLGKSCKNPEFESYRCLLQATSSSYNSSTGEYTSGLVVKMSDGHKYGKGINDIVINKMIIYSNVCDFEYGDVKLSKINALDTIFDELCNSVGLDKLMYCFSNGKGSELFSELANYLGEENTKKLYKAIDSYDSNPNLNQEIHDLCNQALNLIKNKNSLDNIVPNM